MLMTSQKSRLSQYSLLLIDDDVRSLDVLAQLLEVHGIIARTAQNGLEALAMLESFTPKLIITDLSMPQMSGWEVLKRIKSDPRTRHIPVIALTGHAMSIDKDEATLVFDSYITKPFSVEKLISIVNIYFPTE